MFVLSGVIGVIGLQGTKRRGQVLLRTGEEGCVVYREETK